MKKRIKNSKIIQASSLDFQERWNEHRIVLSLLSFKNPSVLLATWFGCGAIFPGPGFWGTLGGVPLGVALLLFFGPVSLPIAAVILFIIGLKVSKDFEQITRRHDSSIIVIDEVAALLLAFTVATPTPLGIAVAVALFRIFDVAKVWPVSYFDDRVPGAWGVMLDDVFAAIYTMIVLGILSYAGIAL